VLFEKKCEFNANITTLSVFYYNESREINLSEIVKKLGKRITGKYIKFKTLGMLDF
jgi:hypothetical protein